MTRFYCILWLLILSLFACKHSREPRNAERAMYFWKSSFRFSPGEERQIDSLNVTTIYTKYFDVDWDDDINTPVPRATLRTYGRADNKRKIIPCIFITNQCILKLDSSKVNGLSKNIIRLVGDINNSLQIKNAELQIDCDWTAKSKSVFFSLIQELKREMKTDSTTANASISATIRLYQVKYLQKTGVPPVDRGMLMAYNMGNLRDPASGNSILESAELKKYIDYLSDYPLELDVALPVFEWIVLFRQNEFTGLIQELPQELLRSEIIKPLQAHRFQILADTTLAGYSFKKGDILRVEKSEPAEILETAKAISEKLRTKQLRLSLFHLDSITLSKYTFHELETFFSSLD